MKYMIRKPDYIKEAACSRFYPNTAITLLISIAIFGAFFLVSFVAGAIYAAATRHFNPEDLTGFLTSQGAVVFSLYYEALIIILTIIYVRCIERRPLSSIGLVRRSFLARYATGFGIGFVLLALYALPAILSAPVYYTGVTYLAVLYLGAFIVQSATEEILFRGYMMSALLRRGGAMQAVVFSTVLFALFHIPGGNLNAGDLTLILLLGAVLSLYALRTGSLWGAMGLHAAWNFFTGCVSPVPLGPYEIGYSFITSPVSLEQGVLDYILSAAMFIAVIALLLFAGKKKLAVPRTKEQDMLDGALRIAKKAMRGYGGFRNYALRVTETAEGNSKVAALLHYAVRCGYPIDMVKYYFGADIAAAVDALTPRPADGQNGYWNRVMQDPIAAGVKDAENRLAEVMSVRKRKRKGHNVY